MADDDPENYSTRVFEAESFKFVVRSDDLEIRDAVEALFSDLPEGLEPASEFSVVRASNGFRVQESGKWSDDGERDGDTVLNELVTAVNRKRLDDGASRLHLHAGLVAKDGAAVLVAGASGKGKTTLVTTLALRGWVYLTDEAVSIALGDPLARSFPKPVTLKQPGTEFFHDLADHRVSINDPSATLWNVPLGRLGVSTATAARPTLIVLLSRGTRAVPSWEPIRPADAIVELVEQTLDLERYGDDALLALAELCSRHRCVHIESGTPEATARLVEELAADETTVDLPVARIDISPDRTLTQDVMAVSISDEAVLRHKGTGQVISLNAAAAEILKMIASPVFEFGMLGPEQQQFVRQLAGLNFVQMPSDMVNADGT